MGTSSPIEVEFEFSNTHVQHVRKDLGGDSQTPFTVDSSSRVSYSARLIPLASENYGVSISYPSQKTR